MKNFYLLFQQNKQNFFKKNYEYQAIKILFN